MTPRHIHVINDMYNVPVVQRVKDTHVFTCICILTLRVNCYSNSKNIYMYRQLTLLSVLIIIRVFSYLNFKYYQAKQAFGGRISILNKIEYLFV